MHFYCIKKFEDFSIFLACNNWLILMKKIEKESLAPKKNTKLSQKVGKKDIAKIAKHLLVRKHEFKFDCMNI